MYVFLTVVGALFASGGLIFPAPLWVKIPSVLIGTILIIITYPSNWKRIFGKYPGR